METLCHQQPKMNNLSRPQKTMSSTLKLGSATFIILVKTSGWVKTYKTIMKKKHMETLCSLNGMRQLAGPTYNSGSLLLETNPVSHRMCMVYSLGNISGAHLSLDQRAHCALGKGVVGLPSLCSKKRKTHGKETRSDLCSRHMAKSQ